MEHSSPPSAVLSPAGSGSSAEGTRPVEWPAYATFL